jgi:FdhD protein
MSENSVTEKRKLVRFTIKPNLVKTEIKDIVALDEPTCVFVNDEYHVTLISTPAKKKELATGFLFSEGLIDSAEDIQSIKIRGKDVYVTLKKNIDLRVASMDKMNLITTACGSSPTRSTEQIKLKKMSSTLKTSPETILEMIRELSRRSKIHMSTGGTHAAMLCSMEGKVLAFAEDVGRHNAIDKVVGSMILNEGTLSDCILISSGRQSGEMVQKAVQAQIPIVASMTAPLSSGIKLADMAGITLVCFARGTRLQIYTVPQRIAYEL